MSYGCSRRPCLSSGDVDDAGLEPKGEVLVEPDAEVALPLGLFQLAVDAHLRAVRGALADLFGRREAELAVGGLSVLGGDERGEEPGRDVGPDRVLLCLRERGVDGQRCVELL